VARQALGEGVELDEAQHLVDATAASAAGMRRISRPKRIFFVTVKCGKSA
jgi:hypothetical protein